jgi:hypothetical protein
MRALSVKVTTGSGKGLADHVRPEKSGGQMVVQKHDFEGKEKLAN